MLEAIGATARIGEATVVDRGAQHRPSVPGALTGNSCFNYDAAAADSWRAPFSPASTPRQTTPSTSTAARRSSPARPPFWSGKPSTKSVKADGLSGDTALKPGTPAVTAPAPPF